MKEKVTEPTELEEKQVLMLALDVTGVGHEGSAVKLKSFTVVTFSVCRECCSLSLRDGKCSKRIFLAADGLILGEALRFFNID